MNPLSSSVLACAGLVLWTVCPAEAQLELPILHQGMCDASAAVALDDDLFVVGDDEDNALRVYSRHQAGPPLHATDVSVFLGLRRGAEVDIEASTRLGDRIYWLSSHGTNVRGKRRLSRQRFFATTGAVRQGTIDVQPVGRPYFDLLPDLLRDRRLAPFGLAAAANRPPKTPGALSMEGLSATPAGHLWIGFRNPIPQGRALLVPLLNPAGLIEGQPAQFGDPVLLDLGGLGIRSIECLEDRYLIVNGTRDGQGDSWLYEWDGKSSNPRRIEEVQFGDINPEAVAVCALDGEQAELLVVSDDGIVKVDGTECKRLTDPLKKHFRSVTVHLRLGRPPEKLTLSPTPSAP